MQIPYCVWQELAGRTAPSPQAHSAFFPPVVYLPSSRRSLSLDSGPLSPPTSVEPYPEHTLTLTQFAVGNGGVPLSGSRKASSRPCHGMIDGVPGISNLLSSGKVS